MKKTILIFAAVFCAANIFAQGPPPRGEAFGGFGGGGRGFGIMGAGPGRAVVTGQPYSATETVTSQQTLANGTQISRTHTTAIARDSQGRISTSETITPPASSGRAAFTRQTIFDPVLGYRYVLDSSTMTAVQEALPKMHNAGSNARPAHTDARPARPNETSTSLGSQVVNGVSAAGTQVTETIPAGAIGNTQAIQSTRTVWISSTLGIPVQMKNSDPRFGTSEMELSNIVQGEPNAALFTVPSGYTVTKAGRGRGPAGAWRDAPRQ